ncbi:MAG: hypothetical protein Q9219_006352 [cf. Caloplaca sp. 3 TL-2023]
MALLSSAVLGSGSEGIKLAAGTRVETFKRTGTNCSLGPGQDSHAPFNPPVLQINSTGSKLAPGLLFLTPSDFSARQAAKEVGPLIMEDSGQLVWNGPAANATNLHVASYKGNQILTYWNGVSSEGANIGHGYGNVTFLDTSYNEVITVCPQFGLTTPGNIKYDCEADFHESFITDRDTLLVTAYNATQTDLSAIGGPTDGWVFDNLFFEIDPEDGTVLYQWSALEHVPVTETKQPLLGSGSNQSQPLDWFHINSVANVGDGYLVNARHTWTIYLVGSDSQIQWRLEGETGGDFGPLPAGGQFSWQHQPLPINSSDSSLTISLFNNYNSAVDNGTHPTTGLELQLPLPANKSHSPILVKRLDDPDHPVYADSQGSYQSLPNGNTLMDYGQLPVLREYNPSGDVIYTARLGRDSLVQSYRGFKQEWHATPSTDPSLVVNKSNNGCYVGFVSWNGATDVEGWEVETGSNKAELTSVGSVEHKGFETGFPVPGPCARVYAVREGERRYVMDISFVD